MAVNAAWPGVSRKVTGPLRLDVVGADVLRDAAGLAGRDLASADVVEQRGLAVIDVAHDRDHRRTRLRASPSALRPRFEQLPRSPWASRAFAVWPISSTTIWRCPGRSPG
jgi:hypothetical protein